MDRLGHIITIKVRIEVDYRLPRGVHETLKRKRKFRLGDSHRKDTAWVKLYTLGQDFEEKRLVSGPIVPDDGA
jgi:hypothetical protein